MAAILGGTDVANTHKFVSGKADGPDPTLVQPSKWNQNENFGGGVDGNKLVRDSGQTDGASWTDAETVSLTNRTGGAHAAGDVVALSIANDSSVVLDDTVGSVKKFFVALQTNADAALGAYTKSGIVPGVKAQGVITRGDYVRKSATTKAVESTGVAMGTTAAPPYGALGIALTTAAASLVTVLWFDRTVGSKTPTVQVFTSGTAATYTTPTTGVAYLDIELIGGGGGGAGGNSGAAAGDGTATTWSGGTLSGGGGIKGVTSAGGAGGAGTNGNVANLSGGSGFGAPQAGPNASGGAGGAGPFGGSGAPGTPAATAGGVGITNTGAGGAGGGVGAVNNPGGGGGAGGYVRHRIAAPAATYTYTVGAGGTAGGAGVTAGAGGAGAAGIIIVTEHYI